MFDRGQSQPSDFEVAMQHRRAILREDYLRDSVCTVESIAQLVCRPQLAGKVGRASNMAPQLSTEAALFSVVQNTPGTEYAIYEPVVFTTSRSLRHDDRAEIAFAGYVLSKYQGSAPPRGKLILVDASKVSVRLNDPSGRLQMKIKLVEQWSSKEPVAPAVVLNRHCRCCEFQLACARIAEKEDSISQLGRIGEMELRRLASKGIFTIKQLSFLYRPRKKSKSNHARPETHKYELQALALRTGHIYLKGDVVPIPRAATELFLDIESDPNSGLHYLIGVVVIESGVLHRFQFWADCSEDEISIWGEFVALTDRYQDSPIFHYGNFERSAIEHLGKLYEADTAPILKRLFNINACIYGKVYWPVRSNGLKDICQFLGLSWTSNNASGLQSIAWHYWYSVTKNQAYRQLLLTYNYEDCENLRVLTAKLRDIAANAAHSPGIRFADIEGGSMTRQAAGVIDRFDALLRSAHGSYEQSKITLKKKEKSVGKLNSDSAPKSSYSAKKIKPHRVISVRRGRICPRHPGRALLPQNSVVSRTIIDVEFSARGPKKVITKYIGKSGYCTACRSKYHPPAFRALFKYRKYGHGFYVWSAYLRMVLRLPFDKISQLLEDLFSEYISHVQIYKMVAKLSAEYVGAEQLLLRKILASPFLHVDETTVSVGGIDQYVWVITDGTHVIFRHTLSREATPIHELLDGYNGVLCSDFYSGYDSINCVQQKCWAHLIRDLNEDLRKSPFDADLEAFVSTVRDLIVPIFEAVEKHGLKQRYLNKFRRNVEKFYAQVIDNKSYDSSLVSTYQKRFSKYKDKLFVFLTQDDIPWNNNMAERALRHIAVQRKISGSFGKNGISAYLVLLGISQSCRFQNKSLLQFLRSGEKDIDLFKSKGEIIGWRMR